MRSKRNIFLYIWFLLCLTIAQAAKYDTSAGGVVKKELKTSEPIIESAKTVQQNESQKSENVVVISEKTLTELQAEKQKLQNSNNLKDNTNAAASQPPASAENKVAVEEAHFKHKFFPVDTDMPDSFKTGFYMFLGLSSCAVIFIVVKIYRLRLSRAERKYGVQGDRTTQELTPLPIEIEDGNSDDEDQTLFDRQQIRIL